MTGDEMFMARAIQLAAAGRGSVQPNPMVGAVIVRDGRIVAEGFHRRFGGPHAEVEAIAAASAAGVDIRGAAIYVTLEPCCHFGKTPPCTQAIITAGLSRVVAAVQDVDPRVAGKGLQQLRQAGVEVQCGVLEPQARTLLEAYIKLRTSRRPWVICKWAQTADGYLSLGHAPPLTPPAAASPASLPAASPEPRWISGDQSRRKAHEIRGLCDAILVGIDTVLADDPLLNNRGGSGRQPVRIVLDSRLRIPAASQLVKTARQWPLIVATGPDAVASRPDAAAALSACGAEVMPMPPMVGLQGAGPHICLEALLDELGRRQMTYLLVEGGAAVLGSFIAADLADELNVFISPRPLGQHLAGRPPGRDLPRLSLDDIAAGRRLDVRERIDLAGDTFVRAAFLPGAR